MISSVRGLVILAVITVALAGVLVRSFVSGSPVAGPLDRALLPGLAEDRLVELRWERGPGATVAVVREGAGWVVRGADGHRTPADARAVGDVLAALRGARWQRRATAAVAGVVRVELVLVGDAASEPHRIQIADELAGTEQAWLVIDGRAVLVDRWVARGLAPEPFALRVRQVAPDPGSSETLRLGAPATRTFTGHPRVQQAPFVALVDAARIDALERAVGALELVRASRPPTATTGAVVVDVPPVLALSPVCPDAPELAWLASPVGDGCITRASFDAVAAAATALEGDPTAITERRLAPFPLASIVLPDGATLELAKRPRLVTTAGEQPVEPARLAELAAVLSSPAELVAMPARPAREGLTLHPTRPSNGAAGEAIVLELLGEGLVHRAREPLALRLTPAAYAVLARRSEALRDRSLWTEEPTTISTITIDARTFRRGAVLGEWTASPAGSAPVDAARVEALVRALAAPRDLELVHTGSGSAPFAPRHQLTLTITVPGGTSSTRRLELGAALGTGAAAGCPARAPEGGQAVVVRLPASVCTDADALTR